MQRKRGQPGGTLNFKRDPPFTLNLPYVEEGKKESEESRKKERGKTGRLRAMSCITYRDIKLSSEWENSKEGREKFPIEIAIGRRRTGGYLRVYGAGYRKRASVVKEEESEGIKDGRLPGYPAASIKREQDSSRA